MVTGLPLQKRVQASFKAAGSSSKGWSSTAALANTSLLSFPEGRQDDPSVRLGPVRRHPTLDLFAPVKRGKMPLEILEGFLSLRRSTGLALLRSLRSYLLRQLAWMQMSRGSTAGHCRCQRSIVSHPQGPPRPR